MIGYNMICYDVTHNSAESCLILRSHTL